MDLLSYDIHCFIQSSIQSCQLIVHFLQFAILIAGYNNSCAGLTVQGVVLTYKRPDHDSLSNASIKSKITNTSPIGASYGIFVTVDQLHGFDFWCSRKCTCGKGVRINLKWVKILG